MEERGHKGKKTNGPRTRDTTVKKKEQKCRGSRENKKRLRKGQENLWKKKGQEEGSGTRLGWKAESERDGGDVE
jgi:hypothetical protein